MPAIMAKADLFRCYPSVSPICRRGRIIRSGGCFSARATMPAALLGCRRSRLPDAAHSRHEATHGKFEAILRLWFSKGETGQRTFDAVFAAWRKTSEAGAGSAVCPNQADRPNGHGEATSGPRVKAATLYEEPRLDRCYRDDGQQVSIGQREAIRAKAPRPGVRIRRVLAGAD